MSQRLKKLNNVFEWCMACRRSIIVITSIVFVVLAFGMTKLRVNTDYKMYFGDENPQLQAYERLQSRFSKDDSVIIGVSRNDGSVFSADTLPMIDRLTERAWELPHTQRVDSLTNFMHSRAGKDALVVEELLPEPEKITNEDIARIRKIATKDPLIAHRLVAPDGAMAVLKVSLALPGMKPETVGSVASAVRSVVDDFRKRNPDHRFYISGNVMAGHAFGEATQNDMSLLIPVMIIVTFLMLWFWIRTPLGLAVIGMTFGFSAVAALGFMGWAGIDLSTSTASVPIIVMTLAIADCVHIITGYQAQLRDGLGRREALKRSVQANLGPVFLTTFTTCIGFLSMNFNEVPPFRDLGNAVAVGVVAAFLCSIIVVPVLLSLFEMRLPRKDTSRSLGLDRLGGAVGKWRRLIIVAGLLTLGFGAMLLPKLEVDDSVVRYFDDSMSFRSDSDAIINTIGGFDTLEYNLESDDGVADPDYLKKVAAFARYAQSKDAVTHVQSIVPIIKKLNKNLHDDTEKFYRIPKERHSTAQYLLLYEMSLPFGRDLTNRISIDKSASRVTISLGEVTTAEILELSEDFDAWIEKNLPSHMKTEATGLSVVFANIYYENITGMMRGTALAVLLITLVMIVTFRSWKYGLLSLVPNTSPILLTFGAWSLVHGVVDLASSAIAMIAIGIVVDDTIHYMTKYLTCRREKEASPAEAVIKTTREVGSALCVTSFALISGFGCLAFSGFKLNESMGLLTGGCILFALVADLLLLPAILLWIDSERPHTVSNETEGDRYVA